MSDHHESEYIDLWAVSLLVNQVFNNAFFLCLHFCMKAAMDCNFYEEEGHFYHFDGSLWIMHEASCYLSIVVLYHKPAKFYVHCQAVPWWAIKGITFVAIKIIGRNKECLVPEIIYFCIIKKLFLLVCKCSVLKGQEKQGTLQTFCYARLFLP